MKKRKYDAERLLEIIPTVQGGRGFRDKGERSTRQLELLCLLSIHGPLQMGEIARRLHIKPSTAKGLVDRLKEEHEVSTTSYQRGKPVLVMITRVGETTIRGPFARSLLRQS